MTGRIDLHSRNLTLSFPQLLAGIQMTPDCHAAPHSVMLNEVKHLHL